MIDWKARSEILSELLKECIRVLQYYEKDERGSINQQVLVVIEEARLALKVLE